MSSANCARLFYFASALAGTLLLVACGPDAPPPRRDSGTDTMRCLQGQHLCDARCVEDGAQDPQRGCRLGCGEPCFVPAMGRSICESDGTCGFNCPPGSVEDRGGCTCVPDSCEDLDAVCGMQNDGCAGLVFCGECAEGTSCIEGQCECSPDEGEPNNTESAAWALGELSDHPDSDETYELFGLGNAEDVDWIQIPIRDGFDLPLGGNPDITVFLSGQPMGADYSLGAWYQCPSNNSRCRRGTADMTAGVGCISDEANGEDERVDIEVRCGGADEAGTLLIRVASTEWLPICAPYTLRVAVE